MRYAPELHGEDRHLVLYFGQVEPPLVDQVVVQVDAFVLVLQHPVAHAVADVEEAVDDHLELAGVEPVALFVPRVERRAGAVVGGEDDEHLAVSDLGEDEGQEIGQVAIQAVVHVLDLDRLGAVGLADAARRVEADVQQVGRRVVAEFELGDGLLGKAQHGGVARRSVAHSVVVRREFQAPFPRLVLVFPAFACENDVPVAGVEVASLFVERAPLGGDV